jgi:myosin heavy subunit
MSDNQNSRIYSIIIAVLLLLSATLGWFFWQKSRALKEVSKEKEELVTALTAEKERLSLALDSLSLAYSDLRLENENLQGEVSASAELVQKKEIVIKQIKAQNTKDLQALRAQIAELQKVKSDLELIVNNLRLENQQLRSENERLTTENSDLKGRNTQLNEKVTDLAKQLEEQIRKTQSASFRATAFRVEVGKKSEKLTTKARRAKGVLVTFDLADVPAAYQGAQKLYLVITDDKGNPVPSTNPVKATVYAPSGPVEIIAQEVKGVNLETTQRLSFSHKFDDRLKAGNYVVGIYCDKGLLGASSFRVS